MAENLLHILATKESHFRPLYKEENSLKEKIEIVATKLYGASCVFYSPKAEKGLAHLENLRFGRLPICMAKTQYSLSDDPAKLGKPENFVITVRDVKLSAGAGFVVALTGDIMVMPGLPKAPAALKIDCDNDGNISGLF